MLLSSRMPNILVILGSLVLLFALLLIGLDVVRSVDAGKLTYLSLGEAWSKYHANSLIGFQGVIEKYVEPYTVRGIWTNVFLPILFGPAWTPIVVFGLLLYWIGKWFDTVPSE